MLASYHESHLQVRRTFELHEDKVLVQARWLSGRRFTSTVSLANLNPEPRPLLIRYRWFKRAALGLLIGVALLVLPGGGKITPPLSPLQIAGVIVAVLSFLLGAATYRKIRFVRFVNREGKPALDISVAGNRGEVLDQFVAQIQKQIRRSRRG